jgi:hypothetical protein
MTQADHLIVAQIWFNNMQASKYKRNKDLWEKLMYESLFAWAGWEE